jgi:cysteine-rich repeat protein
MARKPDFAMFIRTGFSIVLLAAAASVAQAAEAEGAFAALAGQMCPEGSYVIGFDADARIVCSASCGNGVLNDGESCDDGNTKPGDGCSAICQQESEASPGSAAPAAAAGAAASASSPTDVTPAGADTATAPATEPAAAAAPIARETAAEDTADSVPELAITDLDPSWVVFGKAEVTVTITGSGFEDGSVVRFEGSSYTPAVSPDGTELEVTLRTRDLSIGRYPVTVTNPDGGQATLKKAVVIY